MPLLKPGRWTANSADVDPLYQDFWRGLLAAVPLWGGNGDPEEVVTGIVGDEHAVSAAWGVGRFGPMIQPTRGGNEGKAWAVGEHDSIAGITAVTAVAVIATTGASDITARFWGIKLPSNAIQLGSNGSEQPVFSAGGSVVSIASTINDGIPRLWVGRWDGTTVSLDIWNFDSSKWGSNSTSASSSPGTGGQLHIGTSPGSGDAQLSDIYAGYMWNRYIGDGSIRLLIQDPFGLVRPAVFIDAGLTVTLYATADGTITDVVNEADAASPLWSSIDDDPGSPDDDNWVNNAITPGTVKFYDLLTDMPAGFGTADAATVIARYRGQNFGAGSLTLYIQFYQSDESTPLSDEVSVATVSANSSFDNTTPMTITGIVAGSKAIWDGATVRFRWA